jgi:hypothetical protein
MLFFVNRCFQSSGFPATTIDFTLVDRPYRHDPAKLPNLLVVSIAVALTGTFHRSRHAALNLASDPFLRPAYDFLNVFYLAVLAHLIVVADAVTERITFRSTPFDAAHKPLLFSAAPFKDCVRNLAELFKLIVVRWAVKIIRAGRPRTESLVCAARVAAFNLAMTFRPVGVSVFVSMKRDKVLGAVVRMVAVFMVNVKQLAFFVNRNVSVVFNIGDLVRKQYFPVYLSVFKTLPFSRLRLLYNQRITAVSPSLIVHRAPSTTKSQIGAAVNRAVFTLIFPSVFSRHGEKRNHYLTSSQHLSTSYGLSL